VFRGFLTVTTLSLGTWRANVPNGGSRVTRGTPASFFGARNKMARAITLEVVMRMSRALRIGVLLALTACGGDDDDGGVGPGTPVFTSLDVQPTTVTLAVNGTQALTVSARDQNNATMSGLTVTYQTSDATRATVTPAGVVTGVAVGTATITATGVVGGVTKTKTVNVTVSVPGQAASVAATTGSQFDPSTVVIATGGTVTWTFAMLHNVTFTGTAPTGGNIPDTATGSVQRTFAAAGTYDYRCTLHSGMSGRVTVQ
jgi:plastocyanin